MSDAYVQIEATESDLPMLLTLIEQGEKITLTRDGKTVARILPAAAPAKTVAEAVEALKNFRKGVGFKSLDIKELRDTGRR